VRGVAGGGGEGEGADTVSLAAALPAVMRGKSAVEVGAWAAAATGCAMPYVRHLSQAVAAARQVTPNPNTAPQLRSRLLKGGRRTP
jgi:hypothetical protein